MSANPWPEIIDRAMSWHEMYGDRGQWWPDGKPLTLNVCGSCRSLTHRACSGWRYGNGGGNRHTRVPCECTSVICAHRRKREVAA